MSASADVRTTPETRELAREMWLGEKIAKAAGLKFCGLFAGATDKSARAIRARQLILDHRLAALRPSSHSAQNFADRYLEIYGHPLTEEPQTQPHPNQGDFLCSSSTP